MLLARRVKGPARAWVGTRAVYQVTEYNEPDPAPEEKKQISWLVQSDGHTVEEFPAHGETLNWEIPASLAGKTIRVMPFRHEPSPYVSAVTKVEAPVSVGRGGEMPPGAPISPKVVKLEREGSRYYARIDQGPRFYVGTDVRYDGRRGLMNTSDASGQPYHPDNYRGEHGFWADFIYPTCLCESNGYFQRLNTYDRASFTFGFFQHAAHTPHDNFVLLLRELLKLPAAPGYYPDLAVIEGAVHRLSPSGPVRLETETSTQGLMDYLNPSKEVIDEIEAINAAKFIHWSQNDPKHRVCQVAFTIASMKNKMRHYAKQYPLHGLVDTVCLTVADIRHQGRAKSRLIMEALDSNDALGNLLRIGEDAFPERLKTLGHALDDGLAQGVFGMKKYDAVCGDFVPI
jgi:hypothetical protein